MNMLCRHHRYLTYSTIYKRMRGRQAGSESNKRCDGDGICDLIQVTKTHTQNETQTMLSREEFFARTNQSNDFVCEAKCVRLCECDTCAILLKSAVSTCVKGTSTNE